MPVFDTDQMLIARIRAGDEAAWRRCIEEYEGRLRAFVRSRLKDSTAADDIVQETFLGFMTALPNYDGQTPLDRFLFSIASHKIVDALRRAGRRPALTMTDAQSGLSQSRQSWAGSARHASSMARSGEQHSLRAERLRQLLAELVTGWKQRHEWERLQCLELLLVRGWTNQRVALALGLSEQAVANHKYAVLDHLRRHTGNDLAFP